MIPVAANDVAFSIHAVLLTAITLFQIAIYEVSMICISLVENVVLFCSVDWILDFAELSDCFVVAWESESVQGFYWNCLCCMACCSSLFLYCFAEWFLALHWLLSVFKYVVVPASLVNCFCFMLLGLQFNSIEYMHVCTFGIIPYVICFSAGDLIFFILNLFMVPIYGAPMW